MDDVTFGRSGPYGDAWLAALRYRDLGLMYINALLSMLLHWYIMVTVDHNCDHDVYADKTTTIVVSSVVGAVVLIAVICAFQYLR